MTKTIRQQVYNKYNGHCAYCGCNLEYKDMQIDHFKNIKNNGRNDSIENLMSACRMCNFYKNSYELETFREELGLLLTRLEKVYIYRLAKKYNQITETIKPIKFYFENYKKEGKDDSEAKA